MTHEDLLNIAKTRPLHPQVEGTVATWEDPKIRMAWANSKGADPQLVQERLHSENDAWVLAALLSEQDLTFEQTRHLLLHPHPRASLGVALLPDTPDEAALQAVRHAHQRPNLAKEILLREGYKLAGKPRTIQFVLAHQRIENLTSLAYLAGKDPDALKVIHGRVQSLNIIRHTEKRFLQEIVHLPWGEVRPKVRETLIRICRNVDPILGEEGGNLLDSLLSILGVGDIRSLLEEPLTRTVALETLKDMQASPHLASVLHRVNVKGWSTRELRGIEPLGYGTAIHHEISLHMKRDDLTPPERADLLVLTADGLPRKYRPTTGRYMSAFDAEHSFLTKNLQENVTALLAHEKDENVLKETLLLIIQCQGPRELEVLHKILWDTPWWELGLEKFLTIRLPWEAIADLPSAQILKTKNRSTLYTQALLELTLDQLEILDTLSTNAGGTCRELLDTIKTIR